MDRGSETWYEAVHLIFLYPCAVFLKIYLLMELTKKIET